MRVVPVLLLLASFAAPAAALEKPNLVLILVDDLRPEWISSYGAEDIETPNIDELAERGLRFENAYSMPQCTPTRVTLLTGQYPFRHGWVNHWDAPRWGAGAHFDPEQNLTFARILREAGYATGIAGKWQINDFRLQPEALRDHGFNEWSVWTGFESQNPPSAERYWEPYVFSNLHASKRLESRFGPDVYNDFALDFVKRHQDEPFLLYYPMALTHTPLVVTPHEPFADGKLERHQAMVRYADYLVGRLLLQLDQLDLTGRTYVFFTTDNGTTRGITGYINGRPVPGGKAMLTENGIREPFIVAGPDTPSGSSTAALTDFTDILPTFLDLAGVDKPQRWKLDGQSIAGVIRGREEDGPRDWILAMGFGPARLDDKGVRPVKDYNDRVIRDQRYKIHILNGEVAKLFDLEEDPAERRNLIASDEPEHRAALEKLSAVAAKQPRRDARPRYEPLPAQPWDISREDNEKMWRR